MIRGVHAMFYTPQVDEVRAFLRDKLGLPGTDVGEGWLIFGVKEAEVGVHPMMEPTTKPYHEISLYTDDVKAERAALEKKGVRFKGPIEDRGWGIATEIEGPGGVTFTLYQRRYSLSK